MQYITPDDKKKLEQELRTLSARRKELSDRIGKARELGDLSENAEYHAAREDQGHNERRIREVEEKLATAVVADAETVPKDMVFVGATVKLKDTRSGSEEIYRLVGEASGNFDTDIIEVTPTSPMGLALMKCRVGETVKVDSRRGAKHYEIVEIVE